MKSRSPGKLLALGICLSAVSLVLAGILAAPIVRSWRALDYSSTEGTVLSCNVITENSDEGCSHHLGITYQFHAQDGEYEGTRYRYGPVFHLEHRWAFRVAEENPPGKKLAVYYDPSNPQQSVLARGVQGEDLYVASFGAPFFSVLALGAWATFWQWHRNRTKPMAVNVRSHGDKRLSCVCLSEWTPVRTGVGATFVLMIAGVYLVLPLVDGGMHSLRNLVMVWGAILTGGFVTGVWRRAVLATGKSDLVIDECRGVLDLPATQGRSARREVFVADIESVWVDQIRKSTGEDSQDHIVYLPTLRIAGAGTSQEPLARWHDEDKATAFAEWLRTKIPPPKIREKRPLAGRF